MGSTGHCIHECCRQLLGSPLVHVAGKNSPLVHVLRSPLVHVAGNFAGKNSPLVHVFAFANLCGRGHNLNS